MSLIARIKSAFTTHAYALAASTVVLLACIAMTTDFTGDLFDRHYFGQFYDAQAASLLAGRWDVPARAIFPEGFYRDGKVYGYFGFVPALPRMLLNAIFPGMSGSWSRLSVVLGAAVTLFYCHRLLLRAGKWVGGSTGLNSPNRPAYGGFLLLAGLGSTTIFLASCAFVYHEAIIWAVALALAFYDQILSYLAEAKLSRLIAACALAFLCFFCRISTGCGPFLTLLLLGLSIAAWRAPKFPGAALLPRWSGRPAPPSPVHAAIVGFTLMTIVAAYVAINHAKFGAWIEPAPMRFHEQVFLQPGRLERTGGKWMRWGNIPTTTYAYLSPGSIEFGRDFPWVYLQFHLRGFPWQRMDGNGPFSSVTAAMPVFFVLALIGIAAVAGRRDTRADLRPVDVAPAREPSPALVLIGSLGGIAPLLPFCSVNNRYLHDFFPFLVFAAAIGLLKVLAMRPGRLKSAIACVLIFGAMFQIHVNCAFALAYQRLIGQAPAFRGRIADVQKAAAVRPLQTLCTSGWIMTVCMAGSSCSLSPVPRGEGWGEAMRQNPQFANPPLTLTLQRD